MTRSGYTDDSEYLELYRGRVANTIKGRNSQKFLREMLAAFDAMPVRILIYGDLIDAKGNCCAIGAVCKSRGLDLRLVDQEDPEAIGRLMAISTTLAAEIEYENDEGGDWRRDPETPWQRWKRMREWIDAKIIKPDSPEGSDGSQT